MSDSSRMSHVTVTLGRTGRVVKKAEGPSVEGIQNVGSAAGGKLSVRDRLGGSSEDRINSFNKRPRGESTINSIDMCLGEDDLRFRLMQKNMGRGSQGNSLRNLDLRDRLSRKTSRPSADFVTMPPPESAASTLYPVLDPRITGVSRQPILVSRDTSILGRFPPPRNTVDLPALGPSRSLSSWTLENLRRRSPDTLRQGSPIILRRQSPDTLRRRVPDTLGQGSPDTLRRRSPERLFCSAARPVSPERNREFLQRRPLIRQYDDGRSTSDLRMSPTRRVQPSSFQSQTSLYTAPVSSVAPAPPHYPPVHGMPSSIGEPPTVDGLLHALGLEKYAIVFKAEEVDMNALKQLGDNDLKDMGIPMGPRKKILQAVMPRARR